MGICVKKFPLLDYQVKTQGCVKLSTALLRLEDRSMQEHDMLFPNACSLFSQQNGTGSISNVIVKFTYKSVGCHECIECELLSLPSS